MPSATFDRTATLAALDRVADRLVAMVTAADDTAVRVPATPQWTVAEAFAHVATVAPRYVHGARHEGEWVERVDELADLNALQLAALSTTHAHLMAQRARAFMAVLVG